MLDYLGERLVQGHGSISLHGGLVQLPCLNSLVVLLGFHHFWNLIFGLDWLLRTPSVLQTCSKDDSKMS
jgi:hypothetical protein